MYKTIISISIISLILGFVIAYLLFHKTGSEYSVYKETQIKIDTVYIEKKAEPIILEKVRTKIIYKSDTIYQTQPFIALLDTILKRDTIIARYEFPENEFSLLIKSKPDSIPTYVIRFSEVTEKKRQWWETPAIIISSGTIGFLIGHYTQK